MLDDEQQLVVLRRVALRLLGGEQQVEPEVVAVRHLRGEVALDPGLEVTLDLALVGGHVLNLTVRRPASPVPQTGFAGGRMRGLRCPSDDSPAVATGNGRQVRAVEARLAGSGGPGPGAAPPRGWRPDVQDRPRRPALAGPAHPRGSGHPDDRLAPEVGRGVRRGVRPRRGLGARLGAGPARRVRRPERLRPAAPDPDPGLRDAPALAARPQRARDGGPGPRDHRAEGDRAGGVRRVPRPRPAVRRAGTRPRPRPRPVGTARTGSAARASRRGSGSS